MDVDGASDIRSCKGTKSDGFIRPRKRHTVKTTPGHGQLYPSMTSKIEACLCDTFGTVVDWRSSVVNFLRSVGPSSVDWEAFAQEWRDGYTEHTQNAGANGFVTVDVAHRSILAQLVDKYGVADWTEEDLDDINLIWHRLHPWPDSVRGLRTLKKAMIVAPLSNGNARLLVDMAKSASLPWDIIFAGDMFRVYKPDKRTYLGACEWLACQPSNVLMIAAHLHDLKAAKNCGLLTAYVKRPGEESQTEIAEENDYVDYWALDFIDLARQLGIKDDSDLDLSKLAENMSGSTGPLFPVV